MAAAVVIWTVFCAIFFSLLPIVASVWFLRKVLRSCRRGPALRDGGKHVAFFHPYCNAGGGGERVLWIALLALLERYPEHAFYVYTGDPEPDEAIVERVWSRFHVRLPLRVQLVRLRSRWLLEADNYPVFTLLGQSLGSVVVGLEALWELLPDVYVDSMGYAFTLPIFRLLGGCRVACYVHYPTISSDMLAVVAAGQETFNNSALLARHAFLRFAKLSYYHVFALLYRLAGLAAHVVMVNGSWTRGHVDAIWGWPERTRVVYPPCDTSAMEAVVAATPRQPWMLSVAQFRPEKDHQLQVRSFAELLQRYPAESAGVRLVLVGGCRDEGDLARVAELRFLTNQLGVRDRVDLHVNVPFEELLAMYGKATVGLHTMKNEHFGIGIVEMMAAGLMVVAHRSGGPLEDIVDTTEESRTGYLAVTCEEYASCIREILASSEEERKLTRARARLSCKRFGQDMFGAAFLEACRPVM